MNTEDRTRYMNIKRERDLLKARLSTAVDKEILLLNQVIDLSEENARLRTVVAKLEKKPC